MNNEQWKTTGDCTKCRKQKYCSKPCTANKKATQKWINNHITDYLVNKIYGKER